MENTTKSELKAKHGLSLYIEARSHKILFDLGPDNTVFDNALKIPPFFVVIPISISVFYKY